MLLSNEIRKYLILLVLIAFSGASFGTPNSGEGEFDNAENVKLNDLKKATVRIVLSHKKDASPTITQTGVFLKDSTGEVHLITAFNGVLMMVNRPNPIEMLNVSIYNSDNTLIHRDEHFFIKAYDLERDLISVDLSRMKYKGPAVPYYSNFLPFACDGTKKCFTEHKVPEQYKILGYGDGKVELKEDYIFTHQANLQLTDYLNRNDSEEGNDPHIPSVETRVIQGVSNLNLFGAAGGPVVSENNDSGKPFGIVIGGQETGTWIAPIVLSDFVPDAALTEDDLALIRKQINQFQQCDRERHIAYCFSATNYMQAKFPRKGLQVDPNKPFEVIISALAISRLAEEDQTTPIYTAANVVNTMEDTYYGKDNTKEIKRGDKEEMYGDHYNTASFNLILGKYHLLEYRRKSLANRKSSKLRGKLDIVVTYYNVLMGIYNENETVHLIPQEKRALKKHHVDLDAEFTEFFDAVRNEVDAKQAFRMGEKAESRHDLKAAKKYFSLALTFESCYKFKAQKKLDEINKRIEKNIVDGYKHLEKTRYDSALLLLTGANELLQLDSVEATINELNSTFEEHRSSGDANMKGDPSQAKWFYDQALRYYPNDMHTHIQLSLLDDSNGKDHYELQVALANKYFKIKAFKRARIRYEQALKEKPNDSHCKSRIREIDATLEDERNQALTTVLAEEFVTDFLNDLESRSGLRALPNCRMRYEVSDTGFTLITEYGIDLLQIEEDPAVVQNYDNWTPGNITYLGAENFLKMYGESLNENLNLHKGKIDQSACAMIIEGHVDALVFEEDLQFDKKLYPDLDYMPVVSVDNADSTIVFAEACLAKFANRGLAYLRAYHAKQVLQPAMTALSEDDIEVLVYHEKHEYGEDYRKVVIRLHVGVR